MSQSSTPPPPQGSWPPGGYGPTPPPWQPQQGGPPGATGAPRGPLGRQRSIGISILLFVVTLGIYGVVWAYQNGKEMKEYSDTGLGGALHAVLFFFIAAVDAFLLANDVEDLHTRDGGASPVTALTGLWWFPGIFILVGPIVWYVKVQRALNDFWAARGAVH